VNDSLFRKEAVENRSNSFVSNSTMVPPLSFSAFSLFIFVVSVCIVAFVFFGKYSPKDTVRGYVTTTIGGVEVYAQSDGVILELLVAEGDTVSKNQEILSLSTSRAIGHSAATRKEIITVLRSEQADLQLQAQREKDVFDVQEQGVKEEIASLQTRLALLSDQRVVLGGGLKLSERALERVTKLEASEFVSQADQDRAMAAILEFNLRLRDLDLTADSIQSDIRRNQLRLVEIPVLRDTRDAEMRVMYHQLSIRIAESMGRDMQRVVARSAGVISGLLVREGQTISAHSPLLNIIPEYGEFFVEILVPTRTIAFVRSGAPVRIRYDAYPHQKYGTYDGVIDSVSRTTVFPADKRFRITPTEPVYMARVRVLDQDVSAYGASQPLQSGMTLTADVMRDERRLIEWIFDPLISATQRL
jgi:membrane fusion protein